MRFLRMTLRSLNYTIHIEDELTRGDKIEGTDRSGIAERRPAHSADQP
jgi:hypothetical protein